MIRGIVFHSFHSNMPNKNTNIWEKNNSIIIIVNELENDLYKIMFFDN